MIRRRHAAAVATLFAAGIAVATPGTSEAQDDDRSEFLAGLTDDEFEDYLDDGRALFGLTGDDFDAEVDSPELHAHKDFDRRMRDALREMTGQSWEEYFGGGDQK